MENTRIAYRILVKNVNRKTTLERCWDIKIELKDIYDIYMVYMFVDRIQLALVGIVIRVTSTTVLVADSKCARVKNFPQ
jgi:hypothetical protein